jgi:hypothetical protein
MTRVDAWSNADDVAATCGARDSVRGDTRQRQVADVRNSTERHESRFDVHARRMQHLVAPWTLLAGSVDNAAD